MTDNGKWSALRKTRDAEDLSREHVSRLLDPPISSKTLERWEKDPERVPTWRLKQLAHVYRVRPSDLVSEVAA